MHVRLIFPALWVAAAAAGAQQPPAQQKAAPQQKAAAPAGSSAPDAKTANPQGANTKARDTKATGSKAASPRRPGQGLTVAPETAASPIPVILREVYTYDSEGRRDPFVTLLTSEELRPTVADLRLVGVLLDPQRPIAIMRDIGTNTQYRVTTGMKIGRMKVALIKRRSVIFSIEEFGLNRTDSLVLGDTTKARTK